MASVNQPTVTICSSQTTGTTLNSYAGSYTINTGGAGNITVPNGGNMYASPYSHATTSYTASHPSLDVSGDANFNGDIKIKGRSLEKLFNNMEKRLAILVPDPKKLEKFEALQKAYNHYKLLEALLHEEDKDGS